MLGYDDLAGARVRLSGAWMCDRSCCWCLDVRSKLSPMLGCAIEALAGFAISLSFLFSWGGNQLKVKYKCKIFYRVLGHDLQSTEIIFRLTEFSRTTQTRPMM